jgi:hypothetical protein
MPHDDMLDADPLEDDSAADTESTVRCPYCGEENEIALDPDGGNAQEYVEDCQVCCQPWQLSVHYDVDGRAEVAVRALDE